MKAAEVTAWRQACPQTKHLKLAYPYARARLDCTATRETMEQIAAEAHALAEWLRRRPEEPK